MDEILQEFLSETTETMEEIGGEIVAWEAHPGDRERLDAIFRFVHTIKGSSGFLDLPRIGALSHAAEDALGAAREGRRQPTPRFVTAVLAVIDRISALTETIAATGCEPDGDDADLIDAVHTDDAEIAIPGGAEISDDSADACPAAAQHWRTIRVPLNLLDTIMNGISDMVLARNEVARALRRNGNTPALSNAFERLSASVGEMRHSVSQMRMQRIEKLFAPLPRLVRDLGQELGKHVEVVVEGGEVELDREMIESIRDPLTHIIRNAIDHGVERAEARVAAGKPADGTLRINASQAGNQILISVRDDGAGIAVDRLVAKAVAAKILTAAEARELSEAERLQLVFAPGLSTAGKITAVSGRGVGMDIVRSNIERIGGTIDLDNHPGRGLTITLRVPLTLTIISGLTVSAGGQTFAIPRASVNEIILQMSDSVRVDHAGGADVAIVRGERLSLVYLEDVLGVERSASAEDDRTIVITRGTGGQSYALSVADIFDHEELVVKPAAPAIMATGLYAGTTLPDSGRPMLLLDIRGIAEHAAIGDATSDAAPVVASDRGRAGERTDQALLFRDLDDVVRAIRLSVVDRVDDVETATIARSGGLLRALIGERMIPVYDRELPDDRETIKLLRLNDGDSQAGYAIRDVVDVVRLPVSIEPAAAPGLIGGVGLIGGAPVEILDPFAIFLSLAGAERKADARRPLCSLVDADDHWTRQFLAPLLEAAGYRVVLGDDAAADVVVGFAAPTVSAGMGEGQLVTLRKTERPGKPGDTSVYRYDQHAILAELRRVTGGGDA